MEIVSKENIQVICHSDGRELHKKNINDLFKKKRNKHINR